MLYLWLAHTCSRCGVGAPRAGIAMVAGLCVGMVGTPQSVRAWTDVKVEEVHGTIHIGQDTMAVVALVARVRVTGGRLKRFELAGIGPSEGAGSTNDAWASSWDRRTPEKTRSWRVRTVRQASGRLQVVFPGRGVRAGHVVEIGLNYGAALRAENSDRGGNDGARNGLLGWNWSLPIWEQPVFRTTLRVTFPKAWSVTMDDEALLGIASHNEQTDGDFRTVEWKRTHIPQGQPWELRFAPSQVRSNERYPREARAGEDSRVEGVQQPQRYALSRNQGAQLGGALLLFLLVLLFHTLDYEILCRRRGLDPRPLLGMGRAARWILAGAATLFGGWCWIQQTPDSFGTAGAVTSWCVAATTGVYRNPRVVAYPESLGRRRRQELIVDLFSFRGLLPACAVVAGMLWLAQGDLALALLPWALLPLLSCTARRWNTPLSSELGTP